MKREIIDIEQNSPEWMNYRMASIGGSGITVAVSNGKGRNDLLYDFVGELCSGVPRESFKFQHADRGNEFEPKACSLYEFKNGVDVDHIGMIKFGNHKHYSPDGLVGDDGLIEIKTRIPKVYVEKIVKDAKPVTAERRQIQWGLHICEREWVDFIQFCPEMKTNRMIVQRFYRDEKEIRELERGANEFIEEMLELSERIKNG